MNGRPLTVQDAQINNQNQVYTMQNDGQTYKAFIDGLAQKQGNSGGFNVRSNPMIGRSVGSSNTGGSAYFTGEIQEMVVFDTILTDEERIKVTAYLAKKWQLDGRTDSDSDGFTDADELAMGTGAVDANSNPLPDLSDAVDAQIGEASGLDSVESCVDVLVGCEQHQLF